MLTIWDNAKEMIIGIGNDISSKVKIVGISGLIYSNP